MASDRQICRVIESEPTTRKILVELHGKLIRTEKILGIDFRPGDYACIQTSSGSERSLVVALNPSELVELKRRGINQPKTDMLEAILNGTNHEEVMIENDVPPTETVIIENYFGLNVKDFSNILNKDMIKDPNIMAKIKLIFEGKLDSKNEKNIREVFPVVAIQDSSEYAEMKKKICSKADEVLIKRLVNIQTNREVHEYLLERIDRITNDADQQEFFKSLSFYLDRLRDIQKEKNFSSNKMGVIFYPIYRHYVRKFNRETIDQWIQLKAGRAFSF